MHYLHHAFNKLKSIFEHTDNLQVDEQQIKCTK